MDVVRGNSGGARRDLAVNCAIGLATGSVAGMLVLSGSPSTLLAVLPLALIVAALVTRRYVGVETALRISERLRRSPRRLCPRVVGPRDEDAVGVPAIELLDGILIPRAPPALRLARS